MTEKRYLRCAACRRRYNVSGQPDRGDRVYICQDCSEEQLAKMQHRRPRLIYDAGELAAVIYEKENEE